MKYSRQNPSAHYRELVAIYRELHVNGDSSHQIPPEAMFSGHSLPRHAGHIKKLIRHFGATSLLDYGAGKGMQYGKTIDPIVEKGVSYNSIPEYWGTQVHCYDAGNPRFSALPEGKFDAVISTDVLEHCAEEDIDWIVDEMFGYANKFLYANVACFAAAKVLPNGENAHSTIRPVAWWADVFKSTYLRHGKLPFLLIVEESAEENGQIVSNAHAIGPIKLF